MGKKSNDKKARRDNHNRHQDEKMAFRAGALPIRAVINGAEHLPHHTSLNDDIFLPVIVLDASGRPDVELLDLGRIHQGQAADVAYNWDFLYDDTSLLTRLRCTWDSPVPLSISLILDWDDPAQRAAIQESVETGMTMFADRLPEECATQERRWAPIQLESDGSAMGQQLLMARIKIAQMEHNVPRTLPEAIHFVLDTSRVMEIERMIVSAHAIARAPMVGPRVLKVRTIDGILVTAEHDAPAAVGFRSYWASFGSY